MLPADRRKMLQKHVQRMPTLKVVDQGLDRHTRTLEDRSTTHYIRVSHYQFWGNHTVLSPVALLELTTAAAEAGVVATYLCFPRSNRGGNTTPLRRACLLAWALLAVRPTVSPLLRGGSAGLGCRAGGRGSSGSLPRCGPRCLGLRPCQQHIQHHKLAYLTLQVIEKLVCLYLVLHQWVFLPVSLQADRVAQAFHCRKVARPQVIDHAQHQVGFLPAHVCRPDDPPGLGVQLA